MSSPFPGMNPYLEQPSVWQDFHTRMITAIGDTLVSEIDPYFIVKIEEYLYIHEPSAQERIRLGSADVGVMKPFDAIVAEATSTSTIEPTLRTRILGELDTQRQVYLEIRDREDLELVTVIELLSPTNKKPGSDRDHYLAKREGILKSAAHFVEIDLLRGWPRMPYENTPPCDYLIGVSRAEERPIAGVWSFSVRDRIPTVPIPLRTPLPEVPLDLQNVFEGVFDRARYERRIYRSEPVPPLGPDDRAWAKAILTTESENAGGT